MLAKAGEGDRQIKTKMVRLSFFSYALNAHPIILSHLVRLFIIAEAFVRREAQGRQDGSQMIVSRFCSLFSYQLCIYVHFSHSWSLSFLPLLVFTI